MCLFLSAFCTRKTQEHKKCLKYFVLSLSCTIFALKTVTECSAVGSALRSGRRGRAFESPHSDTRRQTVKIVCRFFFFIAVST